MNNQLIIKKVKSLYSKPAEVYFSKSSAYKFVLFDGKLEEFSSNTHQGYSLRMKVDNKLGYAYTELNDDESIEQMITRAYENAKTTDKTTDIEFVSPKEYQEVQTYFPKLSEKTFEQKKQYLVDLTKKIKGEYPKIHNLMFMYDENTKETYISNTSELSLKEKSNYGVFMVEIILKNDDGMIAEYDYMIIKEFNEAEIEKLVHNTIKEAFNKLNPKQIPSGIYPCIIKNKAAANLLSVMFSSFSQANVNKDLSIFKADLNNKIFSDLITIVDDPTSEIGFNNSSFDSEGEVTKKKTVVDKGYLKMYLNDQKSAKEANVEPTGNGFKGSYASVVGVGQNNFYIENGENDFNNMVKELEKGVVITELKGLHAGINSLTGDFSLESAGYYVENGNITMPISSITVSGNFRQMMNNVVKIGDDLIINGSAIGSPSLKVNLINVSGT